MATTMGVKLNDDIRKRLKALGALKERTPHWLMKKAIQEYLEKEEACEREKAEDQQRWQRYQETGEYLDQEEVRIHLMHLVDQVHTKATG
ncbi:MAG: toxin-antitoxin system [Ectothiorhodospiraceae bacterium]|nr:toxin-antitoxin system [Ectothiorhodospiraceae bacterium]